MIQNIKLLKNKKRSLLLYSEGLKDYPTLYEFIMANEDITEELIDSQLADEDKKIVNDLLPNILRLCQDEWKGDDFPAEILDGKERIPCSLCGQSTKRIFYITNTLSGKKLNVGSTCIDEFPSEAFKDGKTKSQILKEAQRNLALKQLNNTYPGIQGIIEKWSDEISTFDVLIPIRLEEPYLALGTEIKARFNEFLDGSNDCSIGTFQTLLDSQQSLLHEMQEYSIKHKKDKYVVSRQIVKWLERKNDLTTLRSLKETGYITSSVIDKVLEGNFISSLVQDINEQLAILAMAIVRVDEDRQSFVIKPKYDITLGCKMDTFLKHFSGCLFGEKPQVALSESNVFRVSRVYDEKSKANVLHELNRQLTNARMQIQYQSDHYDYFEFNQADLYNQSTRKIVIINNLDEFIHEFKHIAFGVGSGSIQELVDFYDRRENKKYTSQEVNDIRQSSK